MFTVSTIVVCFPYYFNPSQRLNKSNLFSTFLILFVLQDKSEFPINGKNENDKMNPYDSSNLDICTHYYRNTIV